MPYRKIRPILILISLAFLVLLCRDVSAESIRLSIVYSDSLKSTLRTIKGIRSSISKRFDAAVFYEHLLTSDMNEIEGQISEIIKDDPKLILTIGSFATKMVSDKIKNKPIIFSAVLNPETSGFVRSLSLPGGNITGASLDIPPDIQFKYFKRVIRDLKTVGVLYSDETANLIPPAKVLAKQAGLDLYAIKITSPKDIPGALDELNSKVDAIWSVADANIFSPRSTRFILLNTLRSGKPFMGFSKNLVESGALFALDYDYKDIGRQSGKIALEVLSGKPPSSIPVAVPGIIWFHYNEKTADHIHIDIPEDLVAVAKEVYR
jgi:putative ABC transport system substrate-binding protein